MHKAPIPIPTLDIYNGQAVLVQQGKITSILGDPRQIAQQLSLCPRFLITDLNACQDGNECNVSLIKELLVKYTCYVAGGIRTRERAIEYLNSSARRIYIGSATELIADLPKKRVVLAVDIDQHGNVLQKFRQTELQINYLDHIAKFANLVDKVAITLHHLEGTREEVELSYAQEVNQRFPHLGVIIAGGKWTPILVHQAMVQGFTAQIGRSLHVGEITAADLLIASLHGLGPWPTVIQDISGQVLSVCSSTPESLDEATRLRKCVLWSQSRQELWYKGETSGNVFDLVQIDIDCENHALKFLVSSEGRPFCHTGDHTCFHTRDPSRASLVDLQRRIQFETKQTSPIGQSYTAYLLSHPDYLVKKVQEESRELISASLLNDRDEIIKEFADLLYHATTLATQKNISMQDVISELNRRRYQVSHRPRFEIKRSRPTLAICGGRQKDQAMKFAKSIGLLDNPSLDTLVIKPRDASTILATGFANMLIGYGDVLADIESARQNEYYCLAEDSSQSIQICICVKEDSHFQTLADLNGQLLLTEYREITEKFLAGHPVKPKIRELYGSTEEFVQKDYAQACVVVVQTGGTLKKFGLRILKTIAEYHMQLFVHRESLCQDLSIFDKVTTVDGVDGGGKSTLVKFLASNGLKVQDRGQLTKLTDQAWRDWPEDQGQFDNNLLVLADKFVCIARKSAELDPYHEPLSIHYYLRKYWELGFRYGLRILDTTDCTFNHVFQMPKADSDDFAKLFETLPLIVEGCSKEIRALREFDIIRLKPTVYSHTAQREGIVQGTDLQRMRTTRVFLDLLNKHGIPHNYLYVGKNFIVARHISQDELPPIEVVVKKSLVGSDKHRYFNLAGQSFRHSGVQPSKFIKGEFEYLEPYVRFDYRNPNHVNGKPLGDFALSNDLADRLINVEQAKALALQTFQVLSDFLLSKNIYLKDMCFMITTDGSRHYGEISSDNGRYLLLERDSNGQFKSLDKDVWRQGGTPEDTLKRWTELADRVEH